MSKSHELKTILPTYKDYTTNYAQIEPQTSSERDSAILARLGKKQVLKRRFGFLSLFGFSCTILTTWEAMLALFLESFFNGGPAGAVYGFLLAWVCSISVYIVIGEMASMAPTAGGQYYWVSMLAPRSSRRFYSYLTGWMTMIAWIATVSTGAFVNGTIIQGLIVLNYPNYDFKPIHGTLLSWALIAVAVLVNTVLSGLLPQIEGTILILHVLGFFGIMIPLVWLAPHGLASDVFKTVINGGNWPTYGISFCVGVIGNVATFVGADAAVHMAEEIEDAALNVPRAIFTTMLLNGALGFGMLLALLFCLGDIDDALKTPTGYPFIEIFVQGTGSISGSTAMAAIVAGLGICAVIGFVASASRMTWSFARDKALPFSKYIAKLDQRTSIPFVAIAIVATIPCLLVLINIGSSTVFNDVISLSVSGFYISYFLPSALLLWRRTTGMIALPSSDLYASSDLQLFVDSPPLVWGPWHVPGLLGILNNAFACACMIFITFWSFWPPSTPTPPQDMNYSALVTGVVLIFSVMYYFIWGRKVYSGPVMEIHSGTHGEVFG